MKVTRSMNDESVPKLLKPIKYRINAEKNTLYRNKIDSLHYLDSQYRTIYVSSSCACNMLAL